MSEGEYCGVDIVWYGERGVVNAMVAGLQRVGQRGVQAFLGAVQWADGSRPNWIEHIEDVCLIVEGGLGQFGDPDLIIVCRTASNETYSVFLEAKIIGYSTSPQTSE